jgi:hypothetical protein
VGNKRRHYRRLVPWIGILFAWILTGSDGIAADSARVRVQVSFVDSAEVEAAAPSQSGVVDGNLAIVSSPGREYEIITDPAGGEIIVSYQ